MDTIIISVHCKTHPQDKPQLGITVEAPYSVALQQQRQQKRIKDDRDYRDHDYQNCYLPNGVSSNDPAPLVIGNTNHHNNLNNNIKHTSNTIHQSTSSSISSSPLSSSSSASNNNIGSYNRATSNNGKQILTSSGEHIQRGLQITNIQEGSVIDKNGQFRVGDIIVEVNGVDLAKRSFQEAQKTLRDFVIKQSSHSALSLKVLRRRTSSTSSLPSTASSRATVIEKTAYDLNEKNGFQLRSDEITPKKSIGNQKSSIDQQAASKKARHLVGTLNTRRLGAIHHIRLAKSANGGFGIKIAERDNMFGAKKPIYITAILTTGSAYKDGRLREGDMLLKINDISLSGLSQPQVTSMLKGVKVNESVELTISRQDDHKDPPEGVDEQSEVPQKRHENGCDNDKSLIDFEVYDQNDPAFSESDSQKFEKKVDSLLNVIQDDGPGIHVYDIPVNDTKSAGLGLYLKYPAAERKDLGIRIENVITGGAAWKDGRLQRNDQIIAINGISLLGMSNAEASDTLRAAICRGMGPEGTSSTIRLTIERCDPATAAQLSHGGNHRIEYSDGFTNGHDICPLVDGIPNANTQDSYRTAMNETIHLRSQSLSNDTSSSSNFNSRSESALSPQTQASNSLKLSNSCNDRSDINNSDKTNDTSSAISQITDFTTVPAPDELSGRGVNTSPKTIEVTSGSQEPEQEPSLRSWDDDIHDTRSGEERFQRDGFGRQSISEKRHAQLMAKNTDTFKRNQRLREERERQRLLAEQLERQHIQDDHERELAQVYQRSINNDWAQNSVRVSRNRKLNESFRAAVDRSYEGSGAEDSSRIEYIASEQSRPHVGTRVLSSVANSTTSTSNDERHLITNMTSNNHKKSSSLLSKFLKFGSMKKSRKNKNKESNVKQVESIGTNTEIHEPVQYQTTPSAHHYPVPPQSNLTVMPNGCQQWQPQRIHTVNGLWVSEAIVTPGNMNSSSIYGQHGQHGQHAQHMPVRPIHQVPPVQPTYALASQYHNPYNIPTTIGHGGHPSQMMGHVHPQQGRSHHQTPGPYVNGHAQYPVARGVVPVWPMMI